MDGVRPWPMLKRPLEFCLECVVSVSGGLERFCKGIDCAAGLSGDGLRLAAIILAQVAPALPTTTHFAYIGLSNMVEALVF